MAEKRFYNFSALMIFILLAVVQIVSADTATYNLDRSGTLLVLDNSSAVNMPYIMLNTFVRRFTHTVGTTRPQTITIFSKRYGAY